jgi:hypothetical protein
MVTTAMPVVLSSRDPALRHALRARPEQWVASVDAGRRVSPALTPGASGPHGSWRLRDVARGAPPPVSRRQRVCGVERAKYTPLARRATGQSRRAPGADIIRRSSATGRPGSLPSGTTAPVVHRRRDAPRATMLRTARWVHAGPPPALQARTRPMPSARLVALPTGRAAAPRHLARRNRRGRREPRGSAGGLPLDGAGLPGHFCGHFFGHSFGHLIGRRPAMAPAIGIGIGAPGGGA